MQLGTRQNPVGRYLERLGRGAVRGLEELGGYAVLLGESLYWIVAGPRLRQPVRLGSVFAQMMEIGIRALPIVTLLAATIGVMLAIQGIHTLRIFGAESRVVIGISLSVTREFAPLITGILIAGRSGSALAARLGTMTINQEVDALTVMAINPVRYLVTPALLALVVMVPILTFFSDLVGLFAAGLYVVADLDLSLAAYTQQTIDFLSVDDVMHGLGKSAIFGVLIALIGVANGAAVKGGAEGVGRATTRAVVQSITAIVLTDMLFAFVVTRA
jgi:phospholipid/cholesterol/gamma-HCH transport system permease protein